MILIISDTKDQSSCIVIDWLIYLHQEYFIITEQDYIEILEINLPLDFTFKVQNRIIKHSDIHAVWYRRGKINIKQPILPEFKKIEEISNAITKAIMFENRDIETFINYSLIQKKGINNFLYSRTNKLLILSKAIELGFNTPKTLLTNSKSSLFDFDENFITKTVAESSSFDSKNYYFFAYTELVTKEIYKKLNNNFYCSFFQEKINKKFEIRTFYLNSEMFSMAIFSQQNNKTSIDFRHYDDETPNRNVPFKLPSELELKIDKLMKSFNFNCGSLDFIYGKDNTIYFLEINPIGQFGMVSYPCNYHLHKKIAKYLSN
ncbi:MAG: grasp-with-spasm system ATP-grasp peptide maturase [Bacteroidales bacterium]|jgi:ATP-GRASP peptide maturase of grasp-with-spasm system|nr:grasp-with-spasm system ATP-grasp peptide maturase [Bacteroidales bacterium]